MSTPLAKIMEFGSVNVPPKPKARRGTSNTNVRGSAESRRRRREWLVETYRADKDIIRIHWASTNEWTEAPYAEGLASLADRSEVVAACRCYRCGELLSTNTVTVDRITPGCKGGTYRCNNIRPACGACNSETGGALASHPKRRKT